jgi:YidC/Oxa1 family membrane protein insertase
MVQKVLLYGSPVMLAVFGFRFPIAVLLYWLTTNLWSMGQQFFVIKKMPPVLPQTANGRVPGARVDAGAVKGKTLQSLPPARPAPGARPTAKAKNRPKLATDTPATDASASAVNAPSLNRTTSKSKAPPGTRSPAGSARPPAPSGTAAAEPAGTVPPTPTPTPENGSAQDNHPASGRAASDGEPRPRSGGTPPVPTGARRPPGGSRPAKRRGKGGRPGGRR